MRKLPVMAGVSVAALAVGVSAPALAYTRYDITGQNPTGAASGAYAYDATGECGSSRAHVALLDGATSPWNSWDTVVRVEYQYCSGTAWRDGSQVIARGADALISWRSRGPVRNVRFSVCTENGDCVRMSKAG